MVWFSQAILQKNHGFVILFFLTHQKLTKICTDLVPHKNVVFFFTLLTPPPPPQNEWHHSRHNRWKRWMEVKYLMGAPNKNTISESINETKTQMNMGWRQNLRLGGHYVANCDICRISHFLTMWEMFKPQLQSKCHLTCNCVCHL